MILIYGNVEAGFLTPKISSRTLLTNVITTCIHKQKQYAFATILDTIILRKLTTRRIPCRHRLAVSMISSDNASKISANESSKRLWLSPVICATCVQFHNAFLILGCTAHLH